jgi:hypothetical protein
MHLCNRLQNSQHLVAKLFESLFLHKLMPMHVHSFVLNEAEDTLYAVGHDQVAVVAFKAVPAAAPVAEEPKAG